MTINAKGPSQSPIFEDREFSFLFEQTYLKVGSSMIDSCKYFGANILQLQIDGVHSLAKYDAPQHHHESI